MGYEFGFERKLDVVKMRPEDWEEPRFDLTSFVADVNAMKAALPAPQRGGRGNGSSPGRADGAVALLRYAAGSSGATVGVFNPQADAIAALDAGPLLAALDGAPLDVTPHAAQKHTLAFDERNRTAAVRGSRLRARRRAAGSRGRHGTSHAARRRDRERHAAARRGAARDQTDLGGTWWSSRPTSSAKVTTRVTARLAYRESPDAAWREAPFALVENDRFRGTFATDRVGTYGVRDRSVARCVRNVAPRRRDQTIGGARPRHRVARRAGSCSRRRGIARPATCGRRSTHPSTTSTRYRTKTRRAQTLLSEPARGRRRARARPHARDALRDAARARRTPARAVLRMVRTFSALGRIVAGRSRNLRRRGAAAAGDSRARLRRRLSAADPPDRSRVSQGAATTRSNPLPDDPGSPWAIGNETGGHTEVEPKLGNDRRFRALRRDGACERARGRARLRAAMFARSSVRTRPSGMVRRASRRDDQIRPKIPRRNIRTSSTSTGSVRTRPSSGMRCATSYYSGSIAACGSSASTTRTQKPFAFWGMDDRERARTASRYDLPRRSVHAPEGHERAREGRLFAIVHVLHVAQHESRVDRVRDGARRERAGRLLPAELLAEHAGHSLTLSPRGAARVRHPARAGRDAVERVRHLQRLRAVRERGAARPRRIPRLGEIRNPRARLRRTRQHQRRDRARQPDPPRKRRAARLAQRHVHARGRRRRHLLRQAQAATTSSSSP